MIGEIKEILKEIKATFNYSWIKNVYLLDRYTLLLKIYKKRKKSFLIISVKKNNRRFHLLFLDKIDKIFLLDNPFRAMLDKYLKGSQIRNLYYSDNLLVLETKGEFKNLLIVDYKTLNIILTDSEKKILTALHYKDIPGPGNPIKIENYKLKNINISENGSIPQDIPLNKALSEDYITYKSSEIKKLIEKTLKKEVKKTQKLINKLNAEMEEVKHKEEIKTTGELLKYNLNKIKRGMTSIILEDFLNNKIFIKLDPSLSPVENMNRYFKKYKKLSAKEKTLEERINMIKNQLDSIVKAITNLEHIKDNLFTLSTEEILNTININDHKIKSLILNNLKNIKEPKDKKKGNTKRLFIRLTSSSGKTILIGRNAHENDELIKKYARGNDLWFHAEGIEGSHVIIKYNNRDERYTENDIIEASQLAAYYSKLKKAGGGNIVYTFCKNLNKPKEAKPGFVLYHNNKTITVKIDEKKIKAIMDNSIANNKP